MIYSERPPRPSTVHSGSIRRQSSDSSLLLGPAARLCKVGPEDKHTNIQLCKHTPSCCALHRRLSGIPPGGPPLLTARCVHLYLAGPVHPYGRSSGPETPCVGQVGDSAGGQEAKGRWAGYPDGTGPQPPDRQQSPAVPSSPCHSPCHGPCASATKAGMQAGQSPGQRRGQRRPQSQCLC